MNTTFTWTTSFKVGIEEVDQQHQKLVDLITEIETAIDTQQSYSTLSQIIQELVDYASYHFSTEEALMDQYHYPASDQHKKEHDDFKTIIAEFTNDFDTQKLTLPGDLHFFLNEWLANHILSTDKQLGGFLVAKGVH